MNSRARQSSVLLVIFVRFLVFAAPTSQLGSLNSAHLLRPPLSWLHLLHSPYFVGAEPRYADVILSLQHHLQITGFEGGAVAELSELACGRDQVVHKVICELQKDLIVLVCILWRERGMEYVPLRLQTSAARLAQVRKLLERARSISSSTRVGHLR